MTASTTRLRRLLTDELGECCEADVKERRRNLESLAETAFDGDAARPVFAALGDQTRYRLARALAVSDRERCVCELEALVDVGESAVSHALADLVDAGLLARRKEGNWRYYRATPLAESLFEVVETGGPGGSAGPTGTEEPGGSGETADE